ncbi:MAG: hypothetical protein R8F63_07985 [Acidimicrobiales bacterium]|nr:hypothetical protein [Acidimicrobiales bacterium]
MRFVELRPAPDRGSFRLHPRITWLRGLDPAARVAIVGLVHDVALGEMPDWTGIVEMDGGNVSLTEAIPRLGETADSALIIDAASLPEPGEGPTAPSEQRTGLDEAQQKLDELDSRITEIAEELAASGNVRSQMVAHLRSSKGQVDPEASTRLDQADGQLVRSSRRADRPDPWTGMKDIPARIEELTATITELDETLAGLPTGDRPALAAAAATARSAIARGSGATAPSPEAAALAQAWISLHQRLLGLESRMEAAGGGTELVAARLDDARRAARAAEDAAVPRKVTEAEVAELEVLHETMIDAEGRVGRGVRRATTRAAFDAAEKALQDALEPLGYPTWAAFRMGNGMAAVPPEALIEYEVAQHELEAAELEWAELMARLERDTELQDVLTAIEKAQEHAVSLLGEDPLAGGDDASPDLLTEALQAFVVDADSVGVDRDAGMRHLQVAMAEAGVVGHEALTSDQAVVALAESWLGVLVAADDLAVRILRDRERAAEELDALESLGDGSRVDRLDGERAAVREAEKDVAASRAALGEVVQARLQLHVLAATELNLAEEHDDRLVQRESAQVLVDLARRRLQGRASADAVAALADRVPRGVAGPIPVVVVMGDAPASTLDRLAVLPDDVQILVIGDGHGADEWIAEVGSDVASVVEVGTLV